MRKPFHFCFTSFSFANILWGIVVLGVVCGFGFYTFWYAKGFSYLTNDPQACKNCHVMNDVYNNWAKGGHQHVAVCNDCHVPHDFVGKYFVKAENGFHHSWAFTFHDVPVTIRARSLSKQIVQTNCELCHQDMGEHAISAGTTDKQPLSCVSCHREVGHVH